MESVNKQQVPILTYKIIVEIGPTESNRTHMVIKEPSLEKCICKMLEFMKKICVENNIKISEKSIEDLSLQDFRKLFIKNNRNCSYHISRLTINDENNTCKVIIPHKFRYMVFMLPKYEYIPGIKIKASTIKNCYRKIFSLLLTHSHSGYNYTLLHDQLENPLESITSLLQNESMDIAIIKPLFCRKTNYYCFRTIESVDNKSKKVNICNLFRGPDF